MPEVIVLQNQQEQTAESAKSTDKHEEEWYV